VAPGSAAGPRRPGERVLQISFDGTRIQSIGSLRPGMARFVFHNLSGEAHSLAIAGEGRRSQLQDPVPAGKTAELVVELVPGVFKAYCPLRGHQKESARRIVVTPRASM